MTFYIDILTIKKVDGSIDEYEFEYSMNDCLELGWIEEIEPNLFVWKRKIVVPPDDRVFPNLPCEDKNYGDVWDLRPVEKQLNDRGYSINRNK